jgi:hypothetical protein
MIFRRPLILKAFLSLAKVLFFGRRAAASHPINGQIKLFDEPPRISATDRQGGGGRRTALIGASPDQSSERNQL